MGEIVLLAQVKITNKQIKKERGELKLNNT